MKILPAICQKKLFSSGENEQALDLTVRKGKFC